MAYLITPLLKPKVFLLLVLCQRKVCSIALALIDWLHLKNKSLVTNKK